MHINSKSIIITLGLIGLSLSSLVFSQATLFGSADQKNTVASGMSPQDFKQKVIELNQQVQKRLQQEVARILPPAAGGEGAPKPTQTAPASTQQPAPAAAPATTSPSSQPDAYVPSFEQQEQKQDSGSGFGGIYQ